MKKTLVIGAALAASYFGGLVTPNIGAKTVTQRVTVQKVVSPNSADTILAIVFAEACPSIKESHGARCDLKKSLKEVRFDLFKDGQGKSIRMHARFRLPGKFNAK